MNFLTPLPRRPSASLSLELVSVVSVVSGGERPEFILRSLDIERTVQQARRRRPKTAIRTALDGLLHHASYFVSHYYGLAHLVWFSLLGFFGGLFIWAIELAQRPFVDCLYLAVSAITCTGLSPFDFARTRGGTKAVVLMLVAVGGTVFDALFLLCLRRLLWKKPALLATIADNPPAYRELPPAAPGNGVAAAEASTSSAAVAAASTKSVDAGVLSLNSHRLAQFHALLTHRQERSALTALILIVLGYLLAIYGLTFVFLAGYFGANASFRQILASHNVSVGWSALFHSVTASSNAGFALFSENLVPWAECPAALLWLSATIFFGNTGFPLMLHFVVWAVDAIFKRFGYRLASKERLLAYILRFPRRLTASMFPRAETLRLGIALLLVFAVQFVSMTASDWKYMTAGGRTLGAGHRLSNAVFQVTSSRTAGFNSLDMISLSQSTLVLTIIAMYVSAVPGVVTMRSTRDRSGDAEEHSTETSTRTQAPSTAAAAVSSATTPQTRNVSADEGAMGQLKRMLLFDTTWVFAPFYIVCLFEDAKMRSDPENFSTFKLLFEIVSAYGTVGLSLGFPGVAYSFSGMWRTGSKLALCAVMLAGRHRGFPDRIDQALMPSCMPIEAPMLSARRGGSIRARRRGSFDDPTTTTAPSNPPPLPVYTPAVPERRVAFETAD